MTTLLYILGGLVLLGLIAAATMPLWLSEVVICDDEPEPEETWCPPEARVEERA